MDYKNPLETRYASQAMLGVFSDTAKYTWWRKLWVALAKAQQSVGLSVSTESIVDLEAHIHNFDWERIGQLEAQLKHEAMAHIHAYGEKAVLGAGVLHLGETSAFVMDNGDLLQYKSAIRLLLGKLHGILETMQTQCLQYKDIPVQAYTHFQPAQPTTVGKRYTLWAESLWQNFIDLENFYTQLPFRGIKGTTGTAASHKWLLDSINKTEQASTRQSSYEIWKSVEQNIATQMGFSRICRVTGQTYDRQWDTKLGHILSSLAVSMHKISTDWRLLHHTQEWTEGFSKTQIGSSAMPYKKNPMKCERIGSLAKTVVSLGHSLEMVAMTQWLERTLDDSANKRLSLPTMFLALDGMLELWQQVLLESAILPDNIHTNLEKFMGFMVTEGVLMACTEQGMDRQITHEILRQISRHTTNPSLASVMDAIQSHDYFSTVSIDWQAIASPQAYIGFAPEQTADFAQELSIFLQTQAGFGLGGWNPQSKV
jgi:adenylosuccinate lyase